MSPSRFRSRILIMRRNRLEYLRVLATLRFTWLITGAAVPTLLTSPFSKKFLWLPAPAPPPLREASPSTKSIISQL